MCAQTDRNGVGQGCPPRWRAGRMNEWVDQDLLLPEVTFLTCAHTFPLRGRRVLLLWEEGGFPVRPLSRTARTAGW